MTSALLEASALEGLSTEEKRALLTRLLRQRAEKPRLHPASLAQRRLWFISTLDADSPAYNIPCPVRLRGRLDVEALHQSFQRVVERHQTLRTCLIAGDDGQPLQRIVPRLEIPLPVTDLDGQNPATVDQATVDQANVDQAILEEGMAPFSIDQGPLLRLRLFRLAAEEHVLVLTLHHLIADGWSVGVLVREVVTFYRGLTAGVGDVGKLLPPLEIQYTDFAQWQKEWLERGELERQMTWWKDQLQGLQPSLELPFDRPRPPRMQERGAMHFWDVPAELGPRLEAWAQEKGATLFMALLSVFDALLHRYTGQRDLSVGTPIANRNRSQTEHLIGLFVNTLVLRSAVPENAGLNDLLATVRETTLGAYAHQDVPFERLVEELQPQRDLSRSPLFEVMFELQNAPLPTVELEDLSLAILDVDRSTSRFDLTVGFRPTAEGLKGWAEYSTDLFDATTITRLGTHLGALLQAAVETPERPLAELPLLTQPERHQLTEWNDTTTSYVRDATVDVLLAQQLERTPDATAAHCLEASLSFAELHARAHRVAHHLVRAGVGPDHPVALLAERSLEFLVALVGTFQAGGVYLPLTPTLPTKRLTQILQSTQPKVLLASKTLQDKVQDLGGEPLPQVLWLEEILDLAFDSPGESQDLQPQKVEVVRSVPSTERSLSGRGEVVRAGAAHHLAYQIFTSGSTGTPKGVMIHHRGFVNDLIARIDAFDLSDQDTMAQTAAQSFDISVWQMVVTLLLGAQVRVYPDQIAKDPERLGQDLARHRVTFFEAVPSLLRAMLPAEEGDEKGVLAGLRWLMPTGEALPPDLCRDLHRAYPQVPMMNSYGPAECSDDVIFHPIREELEGDTVPIGRPLPNYRIHLLDRALQPVPIGVLGQIWVAGDGVGRGYAADPGRTAAVFAPDPFAEVPGDRFYGSGDLGRWQADGTLEFHGRVDHQVKIRGFRIELGEIEAVLLEHSSIREAVVTAHDLSAADRRLVAYLSFQEDRPHPEISDLRRFVGEHLPDYMMPGAFVVLDALPLSPNGKVDRKALRPPEEGDFERKGSRRQARNPTEELLASMWSEILQLEDVGVEDNFFDLGGHSLLASQVIARVKVAFGVELAIFTLFERPTVAELAQVVDEALVGGERLEIEPILRVPRDEELPLSFAQERLWFLDQFDEDSAAYNLPTALEVRGSLDPRILARTFSEMVRRHEVLRTVFETVDGLSFQRIQPPDAVPMPLVDLSALPETERAEARRQRIRAEAMQPFDLVSGPVLRTTLLRLEPDHHILLLTIHHIAADGWSLGIFVHEVLDVYAAFAEGQANPLSEPEVQYADYAVWQRQQLGGGILEKQLDYWRDKLADAAPVFDLPGRNTTETQIRGEIRRFRFPSELGRGLRQRSLENGATLFMTLFAAFETLLYRYSQQKDIVLGTPTANRNRPEIEDLIGFLVNTLALRGDLSGNPTFTDFLGRIRQTSLEAFAHQDLPFEQLVAELNPERQLNRGPIFQMMFSLQNEPQSLLEIPGLTFELLDTFNEEPMFELLLDIIEEGEDGNQLLCLLVYRSDLFDNSLIDRMEKHFGTLLRSIVATPGARLEELDLLTPAERHQILLEWNDSETAYPLDRTFSELFVEQVSRTPQRAAAICGEDSLTYSQLAQEAGWLTRRLSESGVGVESRIAILGERNLEFLVSIVAIFDLCGAYVPLDPHHPAERHRQILAQAEPDLLLVGPGGESSADRLEGISKVLVGLGEENSVFVGRGEGSPAQAVSAASPTPKESDGEGHGRHHPDQLAYVLFTSGSTGTPKGAMVSQLGMMNHFWANIEVCGLTGDDVMAQTASQCFDISVWQFLAPLVIGGQVVIYPDAVAHDPVRLPERVAADGVTVLEVVPSLLRTMLAEEDRRGKQQLGGLQWMIPTGEALPPDLGRRWGEVYPDVPLLNAYGPAECADDVTLHRIEVGDLATGSPVPIGRPVPNLVARVLDPSLGPVPIQVAGEIFVAGVGVGRGYAGAPRRTAESFRPDPFSTEPGQRMYASGDLGRPLDDGTLEFAGRVDHQVKVRGLRIELGEIEAVLGDHPKVSAAVVIVCGDGPAARLVAFVTPGASEEPEENLPKVLARALEQTLPGYMVPAHFQILDELPTSANGKVDRKALSQLELDEGQAESTYVAPENEVEEFLCELYEETIGRESVGIYDNFFDLGGHSLLATQVVSRVNDAFEIELTLRNFFEAPTVAELASTVERLVIEELEQMSDEDIDLDAFEDDVDELED